MAVGRLNPDGSADKTLGEDGLVETPMGVLETTASSVVVQPDGKIAAAGTTFVADAEAPRRWYGRFAVARYTPSGSLDQSFGGDGKVTTKLGTKLGLVDSRARALVLQPNGRLLAVGRASSSPYNANRYRSYFALVRYQGR
jgi:uncharacterized delta-60 repeat protein